MGSTDNDHKVEGRRRSRKRVSDSSKWAKNIAIIKRKTGQAYVSEKTKKMVSERKMGLPCKCG